MFWQKRDEKSKIRTINKTGNGLSLLRIPCSPIFVQSYNTPALVYIYLFFTITCIRNTNRTYLFLNKHVYLFNTCFTQDVLFGVFCTDQLLLLDLSSTVESTTKTKHKKNNTQVWTCTLFKRDKCISQSSGYIQQTAKQKRTQVKGRKGNQGKKLKKMDRQPWSMNASFVSSINVHNMYSMDSRSSRISNGYCYEVHTQVRKYIQRHVVYFFSFLFFSRMKASHILSVSPEKKDEASVRRKWTKNRMLTNVCTYSSEQTQHIHLYKYICSGGSDNNNWEKRV